VQYFASWVDSTGSYCDGASMSGVSTSGGPAPRIWYEKSRRLAGCFVQPDRRRGVAAEEGEDRAGEFAAAIGGNIRPRLCLVAA
jgi:hypothetical protein